MTDPTNPAALPQSQPAKGSSTWIVGLVIFLIGAVLVLFGVFAVGKAAVDASQERLVHTAKLVPGEPLKLLALQVDPELGVRVEITAEVEVPPELVDDPGQGVGSLRFSIPASIEVTDASGAVIEMGADPLTGSTIVPGETSPHREQFDPTVECRVRTGKFKAPPGGQIELEVEVDSQADSGEAVTGVTLEVHDQIPMKTAVWGLSGVLFLVGGPALSFIGYIILGIGIIIVRNRRARARTGRPVEGLQVVALVWGLLAGFGMLVGLIPLLGWTNWLGIPISGMGLIFAIIAASAGKEPNKADALIGGVCCLLAGGIGIVRLVIGFGVV